MVLDSVQFVHSSFADNYNKKQKYLSTYIISDDPNKQLQQTEIAPLRWYHWSQISLPLSVPWASAVAASAVLYAAATIMHRCYDQLNYKALHCPNICSKCRNLNLSTYRQWCSMAIRAPCCWHFDKGMLPLTLKPLLYLFTHRASLPCSLSELTRSNEKKVAHRQTHQRLLLVNLDWLPAYLTIESHSFAFPQPNQKLGWESQVWRLRQGKGYKCEQALYQMQSDGTTCWGNVESRSRWGHRDVGSFLWPPASEFHSLWLLSGPSTLWSADWKYTLASQAKLFEINTIEMYLAKMSNE